MLAKKFVYSWCVLSDLIFMQIFHRVMQMDNIGWEPFETPTIPKIGNGSMGKQWRFLFGICQEATKIALDLTVQKAGYGLTLTVVSNWTSFANTVCSLFFLSLSLSLFCFSINHYFIKTDRQNTLGDLTLNFPTFSKPILKLDFYIKTDQGST